MTTLTKSQIEFLKPIVQKIQKYNHGKYGTRNWWESQFKEYVRCFIWSNTFNKVRDELYPDDLKWEKKATEEANRATENYFHIAQLKKFELFQLWKNGKYINGW